MADNKQVNIPRTKHRKIELASKLTNNTQKTILEKAIDEFFERRPELSKIVSEYIQSERKERITI